MSVRSARARMRGFTLVELMIAVMIAVILMAAAVPSFRSVIANNRLATQTNDLIAAINYARSAAIKRNGTVSLCRVQAATDTACVTSAGPWEHWIVRTGAGNVLRRGTINTYGGKFKISSVLTLDAVEFRADGLARTGGAVIGANNNQIKVCTTSLGSKNRRDITLGAGSRITTGYADATTCS